MRKEAQQTLCTFPSLCPFAPSLPSSSPPSNQNSKPDPMEAHKLLSSAVTDKTPKAIMPTHTPKRYATNSDVEIATNGEKGSALPLEPLYSTGKPGDAQRLENLLGEGTYAPPPCPVVDADQLGGGVGGGVETKVRGRGGKGKVKAEGSTNEVAKSG